MSGGRVVRLQEGSCQISTDVTVLPADGTTPCTVSITAKQDRNDANLEKLPMAGLAASNVTIAVTPSTGVVITQPTGNLDASGSTTATFTSTNAATVTVSATILGEAVTGGAVVVVGGSAPTPPDPGEPFFSDDFAGPAKNPANGFTYATTGARVAAVNFDGFNALRFRFGPDATGSDSSAEQRFNMGQDLSEVWIEYDFHIPSNFALRNDPPANNKFIALWPLNYSTIGDTFVVTEFERNGTNTSFARILGYGDLFYADGTTIRSGNAVQTSGFINAAKAGTWNRIRIHYKIASGAGQTDGVYEGWLGSTLMWRSRTDWVFWSTGGRNYIRNGYLMGWANSGYTLETDFHIKALKFYDTDPNWSF